ncbi:MAG: hypoxanthine phosphoribosyltransferase [bacterium]|nr:hypoxanthine phosphoribosyltransferase [bacterium]
MVLRELFSATQVHERVEQLAGQLADDFAEAALVVIGILNGAAPFMMDLLRLLPTNLASQVQYDFVVATSYCGTESGGTVELSRELSVDITSRLVLVVDGIVDSGRTLDTVLAALQKRAPAQIRTCTLLDKPSRRQVAVPIDYRGFEIDDLFVVGYGMDLDGAFRGLRHVAVVESSSEEDE